MKKQVPDYIPEHDALILAKMRNRSYKLDMCLFDFAGIRFGWSSIIGIVPAFGDAADGLLALLLVWRSSKIDCGLGSTALVTMLINVLIDFVIGIVPFIGDLADAAFKANTRNVRVLEKRLDEVYKPKGLKAKDKEEQRRVRDERRRSGMHYDAVYEAPPATVLEDFSDEEEEERRKFVQQGREEDRRRAAAAQVTRPEETAVRGSAPKRGGWLSGFRSGGAQQDVERGEIPPPKPVRNAGGA
ncbi:hypothetical protein K461DRAFT_272756 [Myriangium duriaei CBS 260.36]|uniref:DUF4112 domain-containing protein n=1 Tax=Myriangium duriaei CBS 260.36 TaxID=1168546 RepID=A0A9P4MNY9_9PEZI|nr:hypothetical protein K461DRAFT_272756 [Myriangium duriaei CBS 260.36]